MEADFINEYVSRLTATMHELISKNVLLETRLALAEKANANLQIQVKQAEIDLEKFKRKTKPE